MPIARRAAEDRDDDLGPEPADDPHDVLEYRILRPMGPGVSQGLREPEIVGPGEELLGAVEAARGQQLLGPQQAECRPELATDQVLTPITSCHGQVACAI